MDKTLIALLIAFAGASVSAAGTAACQYTQGDKDGWVAYLNRQLVNHDPQHAAQSTKLASDIINGQADLLARDISGIDPNVPLKLAGAGMTLLDLAAAACQVQIATVLINLGAKADGDDTSTPVVTAAAKGDVEMIRLLTSHGARLDKQDINGMLPLEAAVRQRKLEATKHLLTNGAYPNRKLANGGTLLDLVGHSQDSADAPMAKALREAGAVSGLDSKH